MNNLLYRTESGYVQGSGSGQKLVLYFHNIRLELTVRMFRKLNTYLSSLDPNEGLFNPEAKNFEVAFSGCPIKVYFDYYEIYELKELVSEALERWAIWSLVSEAGISLANGAEMA